MSPSPSPEEQAGGGAASDAPYAHVQQQQQRAGGAGGGHPPDEMRRMTLLVQQMQIQMQGQENLIQNLKSQLAQQQAGTAPVQCGVRKRIQGHGSIAVRWRLDGGYCLPPGACRFDCGSMPIQCRWWADGGPMEVR